MTAPAVHGATVGPVSLLCYGLITQGSPLRASVKASAAQDIAVCLMQGMYSGPVRADAVSTEGRQRTRCSVRGADRRLLLPSLLALAALLALLRGRGVAAHLQARGPALNMSFYAVLLSLSRPGVEGRRWYHIGQAC